MDSVVADLARLPAHLPAVEDRAGLWSRGALRRAVRHAHAYFAAAGVGAGQRVAVVCADDKRLIAAILGARAAGAVVCLLDPAEAVGQLPGIGPRLVVGATPVRGIDTVAVDTVLAAPGSPPPTAPDAPFAWGIATSGSTGPPRTVVLTERSVAHVTAAVQERVRYTPHDRIHGGLPLHHTYGLSQLWLAIASGACLYLPGIHPTKGGLSRWLGGATVLPTIPSKLRLLCEIGARPDARLVTLAGQEADSDARAFFASRMPHSRFVYFYGLTEATTRVLWLDHDEFLQRPRATGRPIRGVHAWIDAEGELWVEGPNVAAGYLDDPTATAMRFPEGKLRTGDCFEADGDLFCFVGRIDGVFKRFGEKVVPERVEAALRSHPGVVGCLVMPERGPGGEAVPVAWVVPRDGAGDERALLRHARTLLPPVMVPTEVRFVTSLPTTSGGKLVRRAPEAALDIEPSGPAPRPSAEISAWLRQALADRLAVAPASIDPARSFAEYGLDSIGATSLVAALEQWLGRSVSYSAMWTHPTLAALSKHLGALPSRASGARAPEAQRWSAPSLRSSPDGAAPVSQLECRRLALSRAAPHADGRNVWVGGEAEGDFRPEVLAAAIEAFVMRHDVLRSRYSITAGQDTKMILPRLPLNVAVHDLGAVPEADRRKRALELLGTEARRVFDLAAAPLLKAVVVKLAERRHFFLIVFDHVIADAASVGIAWADLRGVYAAIAAAREPPPRPTPQYADFTHWHERLLASPHGVMLKRHWARHLDGAPPLIRCVAKPSADDGGTRIPFPCHTAFVDIPATLSSGVRRTAARHGCTQSVLYHAAFAVLLARASGETDVAFSSSCDFRSREPELREVLGMLTNTCVVRLDLAATVTVSDLLARARAEIARMISASDLPSTLYPPTDAFRVLFNYAEVAAWRGEMSAWDGFTARRLGRAALSIPGHELRNIHDVLFVLRNDGGRTSGAVAANALRWSGRSVQAMASAYVEALGRITDEGAPPLRALIAPLALP